MRYFCFFFEFKKTDEMGTTLHKGNITLSGESFPKEKDVENKVSLIFSDIKKLKVNVTAMYEFGCVEDFENWCGNS